MSSLLLPVTSYTPPAFRYMDSKFVDAYWKNGAIRISSFEQFSKHDDEERLDKNEGKTFFVHKTKRHGGQTVSFWHSIGIGSAYVLSTTLKYDNEICRKFGGDYFRIIDPRSFATEIARKIPNFAHCFHGPCIYQDRKIVAMDLGYIDPKGPNPLEEIRARALPYIKQHGLFLKSKKFSHQVEYRFIWMTTNSTQDYINIESPESRDFCMQKNELTQ